MINKLTSPAAQAAGFVLGALIISLATLTPAEYLAPAPGSDKLHHVLGFGGWALLCAFGPMKRFAYIALFIIFWGGVIELIQPYVNRYGEWLDFYADAFGIILVILTRLIIGLILKSKPKV
jgi:Zn-dependent protease with chaperone function